MAGCPQFYPLVSLCCIGDSSHCQPGTLTVWDNKRVQHYAVRDRFSDRILHRVMIDTIRAG